MAVTAVDESSFPPLVLVRQPFSKAAPVDFEAAVDEGLSRLPALAGRRIAVGVGSRGISNLTRAVGALLAGLRARGALPFLVPAMGSHGGATPEGQRAVLAHYGLTEASLNAPVVDSLDVDELGRTTDDMPVYFSRAAREADGIIVVNRIKPHTDFRGAFGSGLVKMLVVGLGKHRGAGTLHRAAARFGHEPVMRDALRVILEHTPVLGGLGLLENARHDTQHVEFVPAAALAEREAVLVKQAHAQMARLPFETLDFLVVDRIGKELSGTGMDPNVVGRGVNGYISALSHVPDYRPVIRRIFVRDLSEETHGNASGIGMADFTTQRLVDAIDRHVTFTNSLTSLSLQSSKIPMHFPNDRAAIAAALSTLGVPLEQARVARIRDTLHLEVLAASEAALADTPGLERLGPASAWAFDAEGNLPPLSVVAPPAREAS